MAATVSKSELARHTRQVLGMARRQGAVMVESFGEEEVAILDAVDYRLLRALARCHVRPADLGPVPAGLDEARVQQAVAEAGGDVQAAWDIVIGALIESDVSLGRAALLLGLSRFDLALRLDRAGMGLPLGPTDAGEALADASVLERLGRG